MESKNIIQYILLAAVIFLCIIGIINMVKVSTSNRETKKMIDNVKTVVQDSKKIIEQQTKSIYQLQKLNADLYRKVQVTDSLNRLIKFTIDQKFSFTNKSLKNIKHEIDNIKIPEIH